MGDILNYKEELTKAMTMLSWDKRTLFIGQNIVYGGNIMFSTLEDVPPEKMIELPVAEDMQMGISIGLSLQGFVPISIFPRMDFLIIAMNQLVNHLDKIDELSHGVFKPKVIIRTMLGKKTPLDGGLQHTSDYTKMLKAGLKNVRVRDLNKAELVHFAYQEAQEEDWSTIFIERGDLY